MKDRLKRTFKAALRKVFEVGQRAGIDILPRHFYSAIPDIRELRSTSEWKRPSTMAGVAGVDIESQLAFVRQCIAGGLRDRISDVDVYADACRENGAIGFGPVEAAFLYCFVSTRRPSKVVQVGCGVSTAVIRRAMTDGGFQIDLVCVDPYPTEFLRRASAAGQLTLLSEPAQTVPLQVFTGLRSNDLLFVDSTHTVKPGSEVNRLVLEVLPRLERGVYVHFHDITFPHAYPPTILTEDLFFWNESILVQAFLTGNPSYRVRAALSLLHHAAPDALRALLPLYQPAPLQDGLALSENGLGGHFPSSLYLEVMGEITSGEGSST